MQFILVRIENMDSVRTSSLFHFTGKLNILKKILIEGIKPNYCKEDYSTNQNSLIVGIPMTSFCDIPLTRITNFTKRYDEYAIGLSKSWGVRNNVNPILYAGNEEILESLHKIKHIVNNNNANTVAGQIPAYLARRSITYLFGFTKLYETLRNGKNQCNYEENEWRYIIPEHLNHGNITKWYWSESEYMSWRGNNPSKPISIFAPLTFDVNDVNFLILRDEGQISRFIDYIDKLKVFGGNQGIPFDDVSKKILMSKIISIDRIKKDF